MIGLGELLKSKRESKGISKLQASERTKIPFELINSLEKGDYDTFSSEVYLKGFIKNYAKFLGIDTQKALAIYRREQRDFQEDSLKDSQRPIKQPNAMITPGRLVLGATLLIIGIVVAFVAIQLNKLVQPPSLELSSPVQGTAPSDLFLEVESETISLIGKVEVGSRLLINGNEVNTNNLQEFMVEDYALKPGSNEIFIVAESYYFSKTSQIKLTVLSKQEDSENNTESDNSENEQSPTDEISEMDISLKVLEESAWVVVTLDEEPELQDTLEAGESFNFTAKEIFTIYTPRPDVVELKVNKEIYTFSGETPATFRLVDGDIIQE